MEGNQVLGCRPVAGQIPEHAFVGAAGRRGEAGRRRWAAPAAGRPALAPWGDAQQLALQHLLISWIRILHTANSP